MRWLQSSLSTSTHLGRRAREEATTTDRNKIPQRIARRERHGVSHQQLRKSVALAWSAGGGRISKQIERRGGLDHFQVRSTDLRKLPNSRISPVVVCLWKIDLLNRSADQSIILSKPVDRRPINQPNHSPPFERPHTVPPPHTHSRRHPPTTKHMRQPKSRCCQVRAGQNQQH